MTEVVIKYEDGTTDSINLTDDAKEAIRFKFNPSGLSEVNGLKALAGAFLSYAERVQVTKPEAEHEFAVAGITMQTASMWAVLGATKGL